MIGWLKMNEMIPDMTQFGMMLVYYNIETPTNIWFLLDWPFTWPGQGQSELKPLCAISHQSVIRFSKLHLLMWNHCTVLKLKFGDGLWMIPFQNCLHQHHSESKMASFYNITIKLFFSQWSYLDWSLNYC